MNFIHNDLYDSYYDLHSFNKEGIRYYSGPGEGVGWTYPSVTSILARNPRKIKALQEWRKRVGEKEANKISRRAANRGTNVHQMCEEYLNNQSEETCINGAMPDAIAMFSSMKSILDKSLNNIYAQESSLYSHILGVAGRVDCIAEWDNVLSVIDFKTSAKLKKEEWISDYFMQCSAYAAMYYEMTDIPIRDIVVAIMVENEEPQIFKGRVGDWLPEFKKALDEYKAADVA